MPWYVVAREPREGDFRVEVFGPFIGETDARAYAMDLADDNGWEYCEPEWLAHEQAEEVVTDKIIWPYSESEEDESGEEL